MKCMPCWTGVVPLFLFIFTAGCQPIDEIAQPSGTEDSEAPETASTEPYTLRVVFSGLVPLVPSDDTTSPGTLWALIPNLEDPSRLEFGNLAHPHRNRLLFRPDQVTIESGSRAVATDGWACDPGLPEKGWSYVTLADEHLTLAGESLQSPLEVERGKLVPPAPCEPGGTTIYGEPCDVEDRPLAEQARDIQWAVNVDGIVEKLTLGNPAAPRLRADLMADSYDDLDFPLIRGRYEFNDGLLQSRSLHTDGEAYQTFTMRAPTSLGLPDPLIDQAVAREIELVVEMRGSIEFEARSLSDADRSLPSIVLRPKPGQREVMVRIDNEPVVGSCAELQLHSQSILDGLSDPDQLHFVTVYNLLDQTTGLPPPDLTATLTPTKVDGPAWNAQCSPPTFSFPN